MNPEDINMELWYALLEISIDVCENNKKRRKPISYLRKALRNIGFWPPQKAREKLKRLKEK